TSVGRRAALIMGCSLSWGTCAAGGPAGAQGESRPLPMWPGKHGTGLLAGGIASPHGRERRRPGKVSGEDGAGESYYRMECPPPALHERVASGSNRRADCGSRREGSTLSPEGTGTSQTRQLFRAGCDRKRLLQGQAQSADRLIVLACGCYLSGTMRTSMTVI